MAYVKKPLMMSAPQYDSIGARGGAGIGTTGLGTQREVQDDELTSTHVNRLTRPGTDNRFLENTRANARQGFAARGGLNTSLAAAGAENAALEQAVNIGSRDAGVYADAATQNLDTAARRELSVMDLADRQAGRAFEADQAGGRWAQEREDRLAERDWQSQESQRARDFEAAQGREGRDWQANQEREQRDFDERATQRRNREGLSVRILDTIFSNPEYLRDPTAAAGMVDYFQSEWDRWYPRPPGG